MVQSPSWEANWFTASQEIPRISRNPKVHYRTHKRPPPFPILGQPNPVHIPTSHLLEIHPYIIHPSTPRSRQWCLSLLFPHQDPNHNWQINIPVVGSQFLPNCIRRCVSNFHLFPSHCLGYATQYVIYPTKDGRWIILSEMGKKSSQQHNRFTKDTKYTHS